MKVKKGDTIVFDCPYEESRLGVVDTLNSDGTYLVISRNIRFIVKTDKIKSVMKKEK